MEVTEKDFIESGAVRHICYYADTECGSPIDWYKVREYIQREFRDLTVVEQVELFRIAKRAYLDAMSLNTEVQT